MHNFKDERDIAKLMVIHWPRAINNLITNNIKNSVNTERCDFCELVFIDQLRNNMGTWHRLSMFR